MTTKNMLVSTTSSLEGWEIQEYLGVVSGHIVAGTGFFSDMVAGFDDFFGGRSQTYQKQLSTINEEVIESLADKALRLGANCIVGLRIDHDEISGKGKTMFMVTAHGTAVVARRSVPVSQASVGTSDQIPGAHIATEAYKLRLLQEASDGKLQLDDDIWKFLCLNKVHEASSYVTSKLKTISELPTEEERRRYQDQCKRYFSMMPTENVKVILYELLTDKETASFALQMIEQLELMDFGEAERLLSHADTSIRKRGLELLTYNKQVFDNSDIQAIDSLLELIPCAFQQSPVLSGKGLFGAKEKWQCACGQKLTIQEETCPWCSRDRFEFLKTETKPACVIDLLLRRRSVLCKHLQR